MDFCVWNKVFIFIMKRNIMAFSNRAGSQYISHTVPFGCFLCSAEQLLILITYLCVHFDICAWMLAFVISIYFKIKFVGRCTFVKIVVTYNFILSKVTRSWNCLLYTSRHKPHKTLQCRSCFPLVSDIFSY